MYSCEELRQIGTEHGESLVHCNFRDIVGDFDNEDEFMEVLTELCWEADDNYRQYSPFEFFAHDLNEADDSDELWEAYDDGINEGISKAGHFVYVNYIVEEVE